MNSWTPPPGWGQKTATETTTDEPAKPARRRSVIIPTITGIVGLLIGVGIGGASVGAAEPAETNKQKVYDEARAQAKRDLESNQRQLDIREQAVTERESAATSAEAQKATQATQAAAAATIPGDGIFQVGTDVQPGTYRAQPAASGNCYWARLRNLDQGHINAIISNGNTTGPVVVVVKAADKAFETSGCSEFTLAK